MTLQVVQDGDAFLSSIQQDSNPVLIGFFGDFSAAAKQARPEFEKFCAEHPDHSAYLVDVGTTRNVHAKFGVSAVPTVLLVKGEQVLRKVMGVQTSSFYDMTLLDHGAVTRSAGDDGKAAKTAPSVTVYTTDTCPWCTRVKTYLRQNRVRYHEVNVSRDASAARRMVERSGQQGVPQLDIGGSYVVGFDKASIDRLLGLEGKQPS